MTPAKIANPETIDLSPRVWGLDYSIGKIENGGKRISGHFWSHRVPHIGDFVLLRKGNGTTRYMLTKLEWARDPDDMWFFEAKFAPRVRPA